MATEIEKDATDVLRALVRWEKSADDNQRGDYYVHGPELATKVGLPPQRINLAVAFLEKSGFIESHGSTGTAPFDFQMVRPTVGGHLEVQRSEANGQPTEIDRDAIAVLQTLVGWVEAENDPHRGKYRVSGKELTEKLGLPPRRVNKAVAILERSRFVSWSRVMGTAPYDFGGVWPSPEGHLEVQRLAEQETRHRETRLDVFLSHSSLDDELCKDIAALLRYSGLSVFATPGSIATGKWEEQIEEALQNASTIWVLLTPNAVSQSVWSHHEFGYFYGFRHGKGVDSRGDSCRFLYSDPSHLRGLYDHIQGTRVTSFEDPVPLAQEIAAGLGKDLIIPSGWVPRRYPSPATPPQTPWPVRAGGPEFRLSPGFNGRDLKLACSFQITAQTQPGGVEYRWLGVGTDTDWAKPMKENQPGKYQMKEIVLNPSPNLEESTVTLEIRFWLEDGKQHGGRWRWPLKPRGVGTWELRQELGSHVFQPGDGDWW
ncbi:MAG: toll/interleukin-1 receptor domain-containing protein [Chloroflexota bacterium]|nr:toll/interleukin-1 receptor domain-containing protein [Chloroflexota bacterium]